MKQTTKHELLEYLDSYLTEILKKNEALEKKFVIGMEVEYEGDDESDNIKCPVCKDVVAWNDDYQDMRPKHCPNCGTKLIY